MYFAAFSKSVTRCSRERMNWYCSGGCGAIGDLGRSSSSFANFSVFGVSMRLYLDEIDKLGNN